MSEVFDTLAHPVRKWIRNQGWRELRAIQANAIRSIYGRDGDLIVAASTAGGKTEAAFLPLLSQVIDDPSDEGGFDLLYIGPLKALITDQANRLDDICREAELPVVPWHGDVSQSIKARALKRPRGVLMITPESLEALFIRRGLEIPRLFGATRAVVIDELHTVLDSERGVQLASLLNRLELTVERRIRRVGLSATLGDMDLARAYLRSEDAADVDLIEAESSEAELRLQLRGYLAGGKGDDAPPATDAVASHLFAHLRGSDNLVFAGARASVEVYADRLRALCERENLPQEFYPHHASLSRDHRDFVERRLKDDGKPTTAVCTSTLELGIDIGDVVCVAQIGAPFSVAALRQRLGRSGRRPGQPAILRQYAVESRLTAESNFADRLRLGLVRAVAMIELLLEGWCEPPKPQALHLSTLTHQILSVIAERGGASASHLYRVLCRTGPFRMVTKAIFADLLRVLGNADVGLIEQSGSGLLLLGPTGERLVEHYGFYAVFNTPEEYRLIAGGNDLGTVPVDNVLSPGMMLIFSGRRWLVLEIHEREKVIMVAPSEAGTPPTFRGTPGDIHDTVVERMFELLKGDAKPVYMDSLALEMLDEARANYARIGFRKDRIVSTGERSTILATRAGTVKTTTLALALRSFGHKVEPHDGFLTINENDDGPVVTEALARLAGEEEREVFGDGANLIFEKFHPYLSRELLVKDALSSRVDLPALPKLCASLLSSE
ncbi:DEAD/DEAH box helicase [Pararhizobium mangrovi]|uniref:DEAD/DEAH box helicase n=1 Tax=Pararhizobium mangrovi TaxID=2590452 RepID=A0A506U8Q8_9HYPH|nr:DEAD/DEAH box helicase [Pararhizobium mangrovi]TPW30280.1 DEAD/DEAH box helicase [Pararhizobium mangrovi]